MSTKPAAVNYQKIVDQAFEYSAPNGEVDKEIYIRALYAMIMDSTMAQLIVKKGLTFDFRAFSSESGDSNVTFVLKTNEGLKMDHWVGFSLSSSLSMAVHIRTGALLATLNLLIRQVKPHNFWKYSQTHANQIVRAFVPVLTDTDIPPYMDMTDPDQPVQLHQILSIEAVNDLACYRIGTALGEHIQVTLPKTEGSQAKKGDYISLRKNINQVLKGNMYS
jgi:hypothetical protein